MLLKTTSSKVCYLIVNAKKGFDPLKHIIVSIIRISVINKNPYSRHTQLPSLSNVRLLLLISSSWVSMDAFNLYPFVPHAMHIIRKHNQGK